MSQVIHLRQKLARKAEKTKLIKRALLLFVDGYAEGRWEKMLHEEGCVGTRLLKSERHPGEGEVCTCDGDYAAALVKRALR